MFYSLLKYIKSSELINVKSRSNNINLHPLIITLLNTEKMMLKNNLWI